MNAFLKNTLIQQTRMFDPTVEYLVVFRGGQGGNFLSTVLNAALGYQLDNTDIGSNEYQNTKGIVQNTHINLWFTQYENQRYGTETYSVGAYRSILKLFKSRNIKLIILNADYPFILYTELIGSIKAVNNGHHNNNDLSAIKHSIPYNLLHNNGPKFIMPGSVEFFQGIVRHYNTLCKLSRHYGIPHISIDYRDIFLDQNTRPLVEFLDIPQANIQTLNNSISDYTKQNNSLLKDFGLEFPACIQTQFA